MKKVIEMRNSVRVIESQLTDNSYVYDVTVGNVTFHMAGFNEAIELFRKISVVALTVHDEEY